MYFLSRTMFAEAIRCPPKVVYTIRSIDMTSLPLEFDNKLSSGFRDYLHSRPKVSETVKVMRFHTSQTFAIASGCSKGGPAANNGNQQQWFSKAYPSVERHRATLPGHR